MDKTTTGSPEKQTYCMVVSESATVMSELERDEQNVIMRVKILAEIIDIWYAHLSIPTAA